MKLWIIWPSFSSQNYPQLPHIQPNIVINNMQKKQLIQKIKQHSQALQKKILSYGISSKELSQIMKNILINMLNMKKPKIDQLKTITDITNALNRYICKKPNIAIDLLMEIIRNVDQQVGELDSSGEDGRNGDIGDIRGSQIKLEDKRVQGGQVELRKRDGENRVGNQPGIYIKIQTVPEQYESEQYQQKSSQSKRRKRGRQTSRSQQRRKQGRIGA